MLKIAHATWTKVSSAKLPGVRAFTRAERVGEALLAEWAISQPDTAERLRRGGLGDLRQMADFKGADDVTLDAILDAVITTLMEAASRVRLLRSSDARVAVDAVDYCLPVSQRKQRDWPRMEITPPLGRTLG